jgi:hypothetical protein
MKIFGIIVLLVTELALSVLLVIQIISVSAFVALGLGWLLISLVLILGPETISEITVWKASIKRDVQAAKQFRDEAKQIREDLRRVTKMIVEDSYILASESLLAAGGNSAAKIRIEKNIDELSKFAEPIKADEDTWWKELQQLYTYRRKQ